MNKLRPKDLQIINPQIDARLWTHYHTTWWPHHLTKTIMYSAANSRNRAEFSDEGEGREPAPAFGWRSGLPLRWPASLRRGFSRSGHAGLSFRAQRGICSFASSAQLTWGRPPSARGPQHARFSRDGVVERRSRAKLGRKTSNLPPA